MSKKGSESGVYKADVGEGARTDRQKPHDKNPNETIINLYYDHYRWVLPQLAESW